MSRILGAIRRLIGRPSPSGGLAPSFWHRVHLVPEEFLAQMNETMTEAAWLACPSPWFILGEFRGKISDRKLRMFGCACCRRMWPIIGGDGRGRAVETAERFGDGLADAVELTRLQLPADGTSATSAVRCLLNPRLPRLAATAALESGMAVAYSGALPWRDGEKRATEEQARLLRDIMGNPFRTVTAPGPWSTAVTQLAESLYAGEDCAFALHDALLEAGQPALAEHFAGEGWHPKGCWAVDLILGKG